MVKNPNQPKKEMKGVPIKEMKEIPVNDAMMAVVEDINAYTNKLSGSDFGSFEIFKGEAVKRLIEAKGWMLQGLFIYGINAQKANKKDKETKDGGEMPPVPQKKS